MILDKDEICVIIGVENIPRKDELAGNPESDKNQHHEYH